MGNEEIGRKLDSIATILRLVHFEELEAARAKIRGDNVYAAILDSTKRWTAAAKVQAAAKKKKGSARSTTSRKIVELIELGLLEKQGGGRTIEYKATGLI